MELATKLALSPIVLAVFLSLVALLLAIAVVALVITGVALSFVLTIGWVLGKEPNVRYLW